MTNFLPGSISQNPQYWPLTSGNAGLAIHPSGSSPVFGGGIESTICGHLPHAAQGTAGQTTPAIVIGAPSGWGGS